MALSYPSPNTFDVGTAIANLSPSFANPITAYSVSPALPAGLSLNTTTGVFLEPNRRDRNRYLYRNGDNCDRQCYLWRGDYRKQ
jgi:hypothetical protein